VLAALLAPSYAVYAGYELYEHVAVKPGSEEYQNSEKYVYRPRDWSHPSARWRRTSRCSTGCAASTRRCSGSQHRLPPVDSPDVMAWSKTLRAGRQRGLRARRAQLDPHGAREATVSVDLPALGFGWEDRIEVHDVVTGATYDWGAHNYVRLDPFDQPAHVFTVRRSSTSQGATA
jgi:starch synthase (maltosyl-transferring)